MSALDIKIGTKHEARKKRGFRPYVIWIVAIFLYHSDSRQWRQSFFIIRLENTSSIAVPLLPFLSPGVANATVNRAGPTEEEYESGNGPSLPQSPASLEPPALDSDDDDKILAK